MPDDIKTGLPLQGGDFAAEPLYHVKGVDADTKRNARENFDEDLARKKKEDEEKEGAAQLPPESPPANPLDNIRDDVILSSKARQELSGTTPAPAPESKPDTPDTPPPPPHHIDILA